MRTSPFRGALRTGLASVGIAAGLLALAVVHTPPVDAEISDPFRPPEHQFAAGNRGIEYDTETGQTVRASAPGVVRFAGQVAGNLFVTVDHGSGLVTTAGFLESIDVDEGQVVDHGTVIGSAGDQFHFSARVDGVYIDPATLFEQLEARVRLVPHA